MKQFLLSLSFLALLPNAIFGQSTPVYECMSSTMPNGPVSGSGLFNDVPPLYWQIIYNQNDFPSLPVKGTITDLYLLLSYAYAPKGTPIKNLTIQMGMTSLCEFNFNLAGSPKITAGLDTVFYDSNYLTNDSMMYDTIWWRIPLQKPFHYDFTTAGDSCKNILLDIYGYVKPFMEGLNFTGKFYMMYYGLNNVRRKIYADSTTMHYGVGDSYLPKIGFNPKPDPVGVKEVSKSHLSLYPNPATVTIHFSLKGSYTISTLLGAIVLQGEGDVANVGAIPQGLYIVQLTTKNGERLVGRFLKE